MKASRHLFVSLFLLLALFVSVSTSIAELASEPEARRVAQNWLSQLVAAGELSAEKATLPVAAEPLRDGDLTLGWVFALEPQGFVLVPAWKEAAPVMASSTTSGLDPEAEDGMAALLREQLGLRAQLYIEQFGSLAEKQSVGAGAVFDPAQREQWNRYLEDPEVFRTEKRGAFVQSGPLLKSNWHQGYPFNLDCPIGDGGHCLVGCVATAMVQIMNYHRWPETGTGQNLYIWDGDRSCGSTFPVGGGMQGVIFEHAYDWDNIVDREEAYTTAERRAAVALLNYEVAVACNMQFGVCRSGSGGTRALYVFSDFFRYQPGVEYRLRNRFTVQEWYKIVTGEVEAYRPMFYTTTTHAMVCDGYREVDGLYQMHLNYGWTNDNATTWYTIDHLVSSNYPEYERIYLNIAPDRSSVPTRVEPAQPRLEPAAPNPFNPTTSIAFDLPRDDRVILTVYSAAGRRVAELLHETLPAGRHEVVWNGRDASGGAAASGVYFLRLETSGGVETRRAVLLK